MTDAKRQNLSLNELCEITVLSKNVVIEIVEHGIVEPQGGDPESWRFDTHMLITTRKAIRLYRDLEIDWAGIAFAISLLDELEELREEKKCLIMRLSRFESSSD
ncbi:MAG: chaperone modulatory protein CbpM [Gammaproteobacteria bacterium]|nr:chaperone modulatory protein CbpM [Gammaproteobacteria bacterium]